jgi:hypothetical protein
MMMFIGYMGFAQSNSNGKDNSYTTTFPNGDEAITIIENSKSNVLKLTLSEDHNKYKMLELSSHEAVHRNSINRRAHLENRVNQKKGNYTVIASDDHAKKVNSDSITEANQGS